jgi:hypothetical protein
MLSAFIATSATYPEVRLALRLNFGLILITPQGNNHAMTEQDDLIENQIEEALTDAPMDAVNMASITFAVHMMIDNVVESLLPPLFHYTTAEGLKGIVESKSLWSSHAAFMNDPMELNYAVNFCKEMLNTEHPNINEPSRATELDNLMYETVVVPLDSISNYLTAFVSCFCEEDDLLSQWRGYTNASSAVSIGFDVSSLGTKGLTRADVRRVIYEKDLQAELILNVLHRWSGVITALLAQGEDLSNKLEVLRIGFIMGFARIALTIKQPAFKEEREWRIVTLNFHLADPSTKDRFAVRLKDGVFVPYVEIKDQKPLLNDPPMPITSIRLGPSSDFNISLIGVRNLLRVNGFDSIEPLPSEFQLR